MTKIEFATKTADVKTSDFSMVKKLFENSETTNLPVIAKSKQFDNFDIIVNNSIAELKNRLGDAVSISDVYSAIDMIQSQIGKGKFVIALVLYFIYDESKSDKNYLKKLNCNSLKDLINELKECGIHNRQTFYNAVKTGTILTCPVLFQKANFTYDILFKNFSKVRYLDILMKNKNKAIPWEPKDLLEHFCNDKCRDFKLYVRELQAQIDDYSNKRAKENCCEKINLPKRALDTEMPSTLSSLNCQLKAIYQSVLMWGYQVFVVNIAPHFVAKAIVYCRNRIQKEDDEKDSLIMSKRKQRPIDVINQKLEEIKLFTAASHTSYTYFAGAALYLTKKEIKEVIYQCFKEKTKHELYQACLIYLFSSTPEWKNWFKEQNSSNTLENIKELFDIELSQCKYLKRIGENIFLYNEKLQNHNIDITLPGLNEKIYYLDKAFSNHKNKDLLILNNFNTMSAKQFRMFAKNLAHKTDDEPLNKWAHKKSLELYDQLQVLQAQYKYVEVFGLSSEDEKKRLDALFNCLTNTKAHFEKWYPGLWPFASDNCPDEIMQDSPIVIKQSQFSYFAF